jgi:Na+-transporting NADH:ubiquinone oxidoreductase subunit B
VKFLRNQLDQVHDLVKPGGKLGNIPGLYTLYDMHDTILFTQGKKATAEGGPHVRDALDSKRLMFSVVVALVPCIAWAIFNTGAQALAAEGVEYNLFEALLRGAFHFLPILAATFATGGLWEVLFATIRKEEVSEGFLVTGMLIPLILPPTIPLWQVVVGTSFGVVIGKEVFGGVGMNILNPALTTRAFLFFTYPAAISGDQLDGGKRVWSAVGGVPSFAEGIIPNGGAAVDGYSGATPLAVAASDEARELAGGGLEALNNFSSGSGVTYDFASMFWGCIPGSMGESSTFTILLGAAFLLMIGLASWRIMIACCIGTLATGFALGMAAGPGSNPLYHLPAHYHLVMGGFAFGAVFMATDPVSASVTNTGKWIYGILIGVLVVLVRVVNPAYPEGMMLAILFMNVFAPLIDHYVVQANVKRRKLRLAAAAA